MRITIIPEDGCVILDGEARMNLIFTMDPQIHAVQWYHTHGEVEYKTQMVEGQVTKPANRMITSIAEFEPAISAWEAARPPEPEPWVPPHTTWVTARQARLQLFKDGLLSQVESLVAIQGGEIQIEWEYATIIERDSPLTQAIAHELRLSQEQIQVMFDQAALL